MRPKLFIHFRILQLIPFYIISLSRSLLLADFINKEPGCLHQMTNSYQFTSQLKMLWKRYEIWNPHLQI